MYRIRIEKWYPKESRGLSYDGYDTVFEQVIESDHWDFVHVISAVNTSQQLKILDVPHHLQDGSVYPPGSKPLLRVEDL